VLSECPAPTRVVTEPVGGDHDPVVATRLFSAAHRPAPAAALTARQQARRESLVESGLVLLATDGFEQIQVRDVVERAGLSLATMYRYFSSKEHLFSEVLFRWASSLELSLQRLPLVEVQPSARLQEVVFRALGAFERQPHMARLVNVLSMSSDPFAAAWIGRMHGSVASVYIAVLDPMDPAKARPIVDVVNSVFTVILREWSMGRMPMAEAHERIAEGIQLLLGD
jgi:AcrR family transcriptional regulator